MRVKKQKRHRKVVRLYSACFGFREPYKVLLDGTFIHHLLHHKLLPANVTIGHLLGGRTILFTTRCVIGELKSLCETQSETLEVAQDLITARCDHEKRVGARTCIQSVVGESNSEHFFLATTDIEMRKALREVPGVPVIYGVKNSLYIEPPSKHQREFIKSSEQRRLHVSEAEHRMLLQKAQGSDSGNDDTGASVLRGSITTARGVLGVAETTKFKRNRAKGPNPLSCKTKKNKDITQITQNQEVVSDHLTKRKRNRKRKKTKKDDQSQVSAS